MKPSYTLIKYCLILAFLISIITSTNAQYGSDIGPKAVSTLAWDHISSVYGTTGNSGSSDINASIGLTTDKRMYVWGGNARFIIHTNYTNNGPTTFYPLAQTAPFYVPSPAGETIKKVQVKTAINSTTGESADIYFCMSESGKLYAWGLNNGLLETIWPVPAGTPADVLSDTTRHKRRPVQVTILGESTFVDFDASTFGNYWISIGASGKAYHIGNNGGGANVYTFAALPNPAGVDNATFKYTRVWVCKQITSNPIVYLKGNNGKLYYTGTFNSVYASGIPSLFARNTPAPTLTAAETAGQIRSIVPKEVPLPAGVDIVKMEIGYLYFDRQTTYAISADGKGYMTGSWRAVTNVANSVGNYVVVPLKAAPLITEVEARYSGDSTYILKNFVEIAMPPGATKILDIMSHDKENSAGGYFGSSVVGNNNKVYWSGTFNNNDVFVLASNYTSLANNSGTVNDRCTFIWRSSISTKYAWSEESINLEGASQLFLSSSSYYATPPQICVIAKTGRGYFLGDLSSNTGTGKVKGASSYVPFSAYPTPIANEQLLSCQASPGTGGPLTPITAPTNTAVGTIDCSKTQLSPAPTFGSASQLDLIVTVNVTTAGNFTPITVSGSGMTLANNITAITTATTGIQSFHIPMNYDGTALATMNFTVGSAGSCAADLSTKPTRVIKNIWTLGNCSAIVPGVISK